MGTAPRRPASRGQEGKRRLGWSKVSSLLHSRYFAWRSWELHHLAVFCEIQRHHDFARDKGEDRGTDVGAIGEVKASIRSRGSPALDRGGGDELGPIRIAVAAIQAPLLERASSIPARNRGDAGRCTETDAALRPCIEV